MSQAIHAIYENGSLRLLEPVNLTEGEHIQVMIISEREQARAALANMTVKFEPQVNDDLDETALQAEIDAELQGKTSVSDAIIEERRQGP
jgi:predicted DNA-binding antitoxin AbrB/MazE fold protein